MVKAQKVTHPMPFDRAVEQHGSMVLRVCRAVLGPHTDAEDAWSETFLAALRAWPELPTEVNLEAWLVRIAHRKAIDVTRRRSREPVPVDQVPEAESSATSPEAHIEASDPALWAAVSALPDKQRHSIAYRHIGGLSYAEIAEILGGSADAARRAAADGMKTLRRGYLSRPATAASSQEGSRR